MAEDLRFPRKVAAGFYFLLILIGIAFYFGWGIVFGTWNILERDNVGVYALTIVLLGFGVTGYLLYRAPPKKATEESE